MQVDGERDTGKEKYPKDPAQTHDANQKEPEDYGRWLSAEFFRNRGRGRAHSRGPPKIPLKKMEVPQADTWNRGNVDSSHDTSSAGFLVSRGGRGGRGRGRAGLHRDQSPYPEVRSKGKEIVPYPNPNRGLVIHSTSPPAAPLPLSNPWHMLPTVEEDHPENKFSGTVPPVFGGMNALFFLNLQKNQFQASDAKDLSFIDSLVNCSNLQVFSIAYNDLGGVLPLSLANFSKELWHLSMPYNHFSGIIPHGIENLISLNVLYFSGNDLTGQIPEHIGNLPMLQRLSFEDNKLTGYIPSSIGNLTQLADFDISGNKFEGTIPSTMKNLHQLAELDLYDNSFSGRIPGEIFSQLLSLRILDLGSNSLNGTIPSEIGGLINLQQLRLDGNELSGEIPVSISGSAVLEDLNLQGNLFTGSIPPSLGNLRGKRPVDERFKDGMTLRKFVEICASHDRIMEVIDPSLMFSQEQEDDGIEHGDISVDVRKKIECLVSVVALGLACSVESPNERLGMTDVAAQMHAIRKR
ncbi:hypothetical protein J5N97_000136 [Dioscorea zingiberensis]|uniref:Uncharacterized protein n=1 Tax=Dioscorea zingiberensis TaxID=325984 RepID=A0A9D5H1S5_9LILI|nr:hypothetical protein J5N97_000136 [Dioscorea zingiberensis]